MADFLINVRSKWDASSVTAYKQEVLQAIAQIRKAASGGPAAQQYARGEQARMEANLSTLGRSGAIPQAEFAGMAQGQREAMAAAAQASKVELYSARERGLAAGRVMAANQRATKAETEAAEARATGARARAREATAAPKKDPGQATYERRLVDSAAAQRANLERRGLPFVEGELAQDARARIRAAETDRMALHRVQTLRRQLGYSERAADREATLADLTLEEVGLRTEFNRVKRQARAEADRAYLRERAIAEGARPGGTFTQRAQQRLAARAGRDDRPVETFATLGQLVGGGALSAAKYGLGAAAAYGAVNTIQQMIQDAQELERVFNQIEAQFQSVDQAGQFPRFREAIFDIARTTGQAATEVAFVAFQMKGAFQDTTRAIDETVSAIRIARVTGLALNEVVDSLTASALSLGVPIEAVGDAALGIQERFGVLAKETIKATADLAPVAGEVGLNLKELNTLIGVAQATSGRSGTAIAEAFGRILPSIQAVSGEIVSLYAQTPALADGLDKVAEAAAMGQSGQILIQLIRDYAKLDATTQGYVITLLGGRREAQALIPVLRNSGRFVAELDRQQSDAGKTADYFAKLQDTLAQAVARAAQMFRELGQALFNAGLGQALRDLVTVAGGLLQVLGGLVGMMSSFNQATGGSVAKVLELLIALRALKALAAAIGIGGALKAATAVSGTTASGAASTALALGGLGFGGGGAAARGGATLYRPPTPSPGLLARAGSRVAGIGTAAGAALGINPLTATAAIAGAVLFKKYNEADDKVDKAAEGFAEKIAKARDENLAAVAEEQLSIGDRVRQKLFGQKDPNKQAFDELQRRRYQKGGIKERAAGIDQAGLLAQAGISQKDLDDLRTRADAGDRKSIDRLEQIVNALAGDPATASQFQTGVQQARDALETQNQNNQVISGETLKRVQDIDAAYRAGTASYGDYVVAMRVALEGYRKIREKGPLSPELAKQEADIARGFNQTLDDKARQLVDYNLRIAELSGGGGAAAKVEAYTTLLQSGQLKTPEAQTKTAEDIVEASLQLLQDEADMAETAAERYAILSRGAQIPDAARVTVLQNAALQFNTVWVAFLTETFKDQTYITNLIHGIATNTVASGRNFIDQARIDAENKIRDLQAKVNALKGAGQYGPFLEESEIGRLTQFLNQLPSLPDITGLPPTVKPSGKDLKDAAKAKQREAEARAKEEKQAQEEIENARFNLLRAQAGGDPVRVAQIAVDQARAAGRRASTEAERINAQAQLIEAEQGLFDAHQAAADAYLNLDKALAEARGDAVGAALIEVKQARRNLDNARKRGNNEAAVLAEAELVRSEANAVNTQISEGTRRIDTALQLERMTTGAAIEELRLLQRIPGATQERIDELEIKIRALQKDASANQAFNIPNDIKLPTLYEVRRANQTAAIGQSYQDARVITINFTANNTADAQGIANEIVDRFSGPSRFGALPRRY